MPAKPEIQKIEPSRVARELISKPLGTYLVRESTEDDDIITEIQHKSEINARRPYIVLAVRVDEAKYKFPIMNYRLPLADSIDLLEEYERKQCTSRMHQLPDLREELIVNSENDDWQIEKRSVSRYRSVFPCWNGDEPVFKTHYSFEDGDNQTSFWEKPCKAGQSLQHEFSILKNLSYAHIVSFYGIYCNADQIQSLIFLHHGRSLKYAYPTIKLSQPWLTMQLSMIGYQIACGMVYLELKHIVHRDLHAGNILIDERNVIRIADFEHAVIQDENENECHKTRENSKKHFQLRWRAPECLPSLRGNEQNSDSDESLLAQFSSKSDVWAYGLIFVELLLKLNQGIYPNLPVKKRDEEEFTQFIEYIKSDPPHIHPKPDECPEQFYGLLIQCWRYQPDERPSFRTIRDEMLKLFQSEDSQLEF